MRLSRTAWPLVGAAGLALVLTSACGSTGGSNVGNGNTSGDGTGANGNGNAGTAGGLNLGNLAGSATSGGTNSVGEACAGELVKAERIPLDMYMMLDISGSMLVPTEGDANVTKWQAVSSALTDFVSDPASDGMGVGLQVFPIRDPDAPRSCTSDAACGKFGPCFLKTCWNTTEFVSCNNNFNCAGDTGPCTAFAYCAESDAYICPATDVGKDCGTDPQTNKPLGICTAECIASSDCRPAVYAAPAAPIAALPGAKAGLVAVISKAMPEGVTPTGPALQGAIDQAGSWAKAHPERQVVAVLATDGVPTTCDPTASADVAALAASGRRLTPAVSTFVIGVFGANDTEGPANLNGIAKSGGTGSAFIIDTQGDVQKQFRDALNKIRATGLSCELAVPAAEAGQSLDYDRVNVSFDNGTGPTDLLSWGDASGCGADGGWYYDVPPAQGVPKRIVACPTTCSAFQKTDMGSVQIKLGCKTKVK